MGALGASVGLSECLAIAYQQVGIREKGSRQRDEPVVVVDGCLRDLFQIGAQRTLARDALASASIKEGRCCWRAERKRSSLLSKCL